MAGPQCVCAAVLLCNQQALLEQGIHNGWLGYVCTASFVHTNYTVYITNKHVHEENAYNIIR